jgi:hypothetical protein
MREQAPIASVAKLLEVLYIDTGEREKVSTAIELSSSGTPSVIEYFDDGKGHSGAVTSTYTLLEQDVFQKALASGYIIQSRTSRGIVPPDRFVLSDLGQQAHVARLDQEQKAREVEEEQAAIANHTPEFNND